MPELVIDAEIWSDAYDLARRCRAAGVTVPATGILTAACARHQGRASGARRRDFDAIARVSVREGSR